MNCASSADRRLSFSRLVSSMVILFGVRRLDAAFVAANLTVASFNRKRRQAAALQREATNFAGGTFYARCAYFAASRLKVFTLRNVVAAPNVFSSNVPESGESANGVWHNQ